MIMMPTVVGDGDDAAVVNYRGCVFPSIRCWCSASSTNMKLLVARQSDDDDDDDDDHEGGDNMAVMSCSPVVIFIPYCQAGVFPCQCTCLAISGTTA